MKQTRGYTTVGERMESCRGFTSGFDYLRLFLSIAVLTYHSFGIVYGAEIVGIVWQGPWRAIVGSVLPVFFALSGFLVAASLERTAKLTTFMTYRAVRIVPALAVEVTLSALLIGPIVTTLPLYEYFTHPDTWSYFYNIIGHIHYTLPGVFENNPRPLVNVSLWTVPYELECYIALFLLAITGIVRKRVLLLVGVIAAMYGAMLAMHFLGYGKSSLNPTGLMLIGSFLAGVVLYQWRDKLPLSPKLFFICLVLMPIFMFKPVIAFLGVFFAAYCAVFVGMQNPPKREFFVQGDYSYGIYLFAFPVQQICVALFPQFQNPYFNIGFSIPVSFLCAYVSWHFIEKGLLKRKKFFASNAQRFVDAIAGRLKKIKP